MATLAAAHYVDSARNLNDSVATSTVTFGTASFTQGISVDPNLSHIEAEVVNILADGVVQAQQTVTSGAITEPGGVTHVGLPYRAELQPMKFDETTGFQQRIIKTWTRFFQTLAAKIGISITDTDDVEFSSTTSLNTEEVEFPFMGQYDRDGDIFVVSTDPVPVTVLAHIMEVTASDS